MDSSEVGSGKGDETPMSAQSLYSALGLSSEDIEALAKIPEKEITVDTLPSLIMQLKAKRAESAKAATDTEGSEQTETKQPEEKEEPSGKKSDSSPAKISELEASSHDQENPEKNDDKKKADRTTAGGKREDKGRKSSKEGQREEDITDEDLDDKPTVFPHICSLCKIESNGLKAWHGHLQGMRHAKAKAEYLKLASSPDESYASRRGPRSGKRPHSSEKNSGDLPSSERFFHSSMPSTRVVVAKFPMGCLAVADLLGLGKPFGKVVKHLLFPFKGFLEFSSHREAKDMVNHYQHKPAFIKGSFISLSLSTNVKVIHDPTDFHEPGPKRMKSAQSVVCFSRLPPGKENEEKVLELAGLFGNVRNSKFSDDKALIEMADWRDADIMLKYYHSNPLRIQDKNIKVYLSALPTLSEGSSERSSKRSDSSRSRSSRQKTESSSSSKSTAQSSSKDKDKEKDGEEGEKGKEKAEGEKADKKEEKLEHEGVQMEDESSLMETDEAEAVGTATEEEEEKKDCTKTGEEKKAEEKQCSEQKKNKEKQGSGEDAEEQEDLEDVDFPDNLDDFVTLDELDTATDSKDFADFPEGKVVLVKPIMFMYRKDHRSAMIKDLYKLAAPFGKVVNFAISFYKHEAMLELESQEKAREMVTHYRSTRTKLRGRHINITINPSLKTIEDPSGRTLFISNIPRFGSLEMPLLKTIRPFGKITGYTFSLQYGTCYIQMEKVEAAKLVIERYSRYPLKFSGSTLKITKCKKGDSLIFWNSPDVIEHWFEAQQSKKSERRRENGQTSKGENRHSSRLEGVCGDPSADDSDEDKMDQAPLSPFEPNKPVGVSYVVSRTGFFCKLCNIFYTDEKRAKSDHCSSLEHYNMLKRKREKVKSKPLPDPQVTKKKKKKPTEKKEEKQEEEQKEEQVEEQVEAPEDEQQETLEEEEQEDEQIEAQEEEQEEAQEDAEAQEEEEPPQQQEDK